MTAQAHCNLLSWVQAGHRQRTNAGPENLVLAGSYEQMGLTRMSCSARISLSVRRKLPIHKD